MARTLPKRRRTAGFSVVELMVAMTIGLLLLAGVLSVMYSSRVAYDENTRFSRLQEYARSSIELMLRDLRSAGYWGCSAPLINDSFENTFVNRNTYRYNFANAVQGLEGTAGVFAPAPVLPDDIAAVTAATAGNDIVIVRTTNPLFPPMRLTAGVIGGSNLPITKPAGLVIPQGTPLLVSNCATSTVLTTTTPLPAGANVVATVLGGAYVPAGGSVTRPINDGQPLPNYGVGSQVAALETVIYYIRPSVTGRGPALWRVAGNAAPAELVEGVERLEVRYGVDTDNNSRVDAYVDADAVADWGDVYSVSLAVLMRSPEEGPQPPAAGQTFDMLGTIVGPFADQRSRILLNTTVNLRPRTPS